VTTLGPTVLTLTPASLNLFSDYRQLTQFPFMVNALEAGTLVAIMAGVVGWFMVLRRQSFAGHTMSVLAFPGATGALLAGVPAPLGYFVFCTLAAGLIGGGGTAGRRRERSDEAAVTGVVLAFGLACGFLFLSLYHGILGGYESLLFGSFLGITRGQVVALGVVAAVAVGFLGVAGRPLLFASVDEAVARAGGVPTHALGLAFLLVLGLAVAATAQVTGVLLVFALLVAPAATAQQITTRIGLSLALTVVLGVLISWLGLSLGYFFGYPVGFYISTIAFGAYLLARLCRALADRPSRFRAGARA
jgi:zinc/manganese transport system permease protein